MHFPNELEVSRMQSRASLVLPPSIMNKVTPLPTGGPRHSFHSDSPPPPPPFSPALDRACDLRACTERAEVEATLDCPLEPVGFSRTVPSHPIGPSPPPFPYL